MPELSGFQIQHIQSARISANPQFLSIQTKRMHIVIGKTIFAGLWHKCLKTNPSEDKKQFKPAIIDRKPYIYPLLVFTKATQRCYR
jgi:hypothetical protein